MVGGIPQMEPALGSLCFGITRVIQYLRMYLPGQIEHIQGQGPHLLLFLGPW